MSLDSRTPVSIVSLSLVSIVSLSWVYIVSLSLDSSKVGGIPLSAGCPTPPPPTSTRGRSQIQIRQHQDDCVTYLGGQSLLHRVTLAGQSSRRMVKLEPSSNHRLQHQGVLLPKKVYKRMIPSIQIYQQKASGL